MSAELVTSVDEWAGRIRPHLVQAVESIVDAGRELIEAKAALPHGGFGPLLVELGLSRHHANRFMRVAAHPVLSNCAPAHNLPAAVTVLDELTKLPEDELEAAIADGTITASTTRQQAAHLVSRAKADATDPHVLRQVRFVPPLVAAEIPRDLDDARRRLTSGEAFGARLWDRLTREQIDELATLYAETVCVRVAARTLVRGGGMHSPPDYWRSGDADRLTSWTDRVVADATEFVNWCEAAGAVVDGHLELPADRLLTYPHADISPTDWGPEDWDLAARGHFWAFIATPEEYPHGPQAVTA